MDNTDSMFSLGIFMKNKIEKILISIEMSYFKQKKNIDHQKVKEVQGFMQFKSYYCIFKKFHLS